MRKTIRIGHEKLADQKRCFSFDDYHVSLKRYDNFPNGINPK